MTTTTQARVPSGTPTGGQFACQDRAESTEHLAAPSKLADVLRRLSAGEVGTHSDDWGTNLLTPAELDLPAANHLAVQLPLDTALNTVDVDSLPIIEVPVSSLRLADDQLRADALEWYLNRDDDGEHWDDQVSFYGAAGPLAFRRGDEYWLIDGNHRAARAIITGAETFRLQAFDLEETP